MATYTSEEDYLSSQEPSSYTTEDDYLPPKDRNTTAARKMSKTQTAINTAADAQEKVNLALQQAWYKLTGNRPQLQRIQNRLDVMDTEYNDFYKHSDNPNSTAASVGSVLGGITHPLSMGTMPLGGGATIPARAGNQGAIAALYEMITNPGTITDRLGHGGTGFIGGAIGSAGMDTLAKGSSGLMGKWEDKVAQHGDTLSKKGNTRPGIGQLKEYSNRMVDPDQLRQRGSNLPFALEKHASHAQEADGRALAIAMGVTPDPRTAVALPKEDARQLHNVLSKEAEDIWSPFYKEARKIKDKVWPVELWQSLKNLERHNSKVLNDSSAIPDDVVRDQLQSILYTVDKNGRTVPRSNSATLPKFSPEEYTRIISSLGEAQHRLSILSKGEAPSYNSEAVQRMTDAFGAAKDSMRTWGSKRPDVLNAWETSMQRYQDEIIPVRQNDVLKVASELEPRGRDIDGLMGTTSDRNNYDQLRDLIRAYRDKGMGDAADRLDLLDANSLASGHRASGNLAINGAPSMRTATRDTGDVFSLVGDAASKLTSSPMAKGWYFGDPLLGIRADTSKNKFGEQLMDSFIGDIEHSSIPRGALSSVVRKSPISASRELGYEDLIGVLGLIDVLGLEESTDKTSNDPGGHDSTPAVLNQMGTR